jgi:apolipoprotein N-acyltransferase
MPLLALIAWTLASSATLALSYPPFSLSALGWIGLVPLFVVIRSSSRGHAALVACVFVSTLTLIVVSWIPGVMDSRFHAGFVGAYGVWLLLGLAGIPAAAIFGVDG